MINYKNFIEAEKSILIAPAGYGKTHTISECLKYTKWKQLILTHTHAWISSIKKKLQKAWIWSSNYNVETITSFSQKFVLSFYVWNDIPAQEEWSLYYSFILEKAVELFKLDIIKKIIGISYTWLFVDEYQDCTELQHDLILELWNILPTHILWDYLQWIFNFNDDLIDLKDTDKLEKFYEKYFELDTPWRWNIGLNPQLGEDLKDIRWKLIVWQNIELTWYSSIETIITNDFYSTHYTKIIDLITGNKSILIIDPISNSINSRLNFTRRFRNSCMLLESIDNKKFYEYAKLMDTFSQADIILNIRNFSYNFFSRVWINTRFNSTWLKRKVNVVDKKKSEEIQIILDELLLGLSYKKIAHTLKLIGKLPGIKIFRKDLFYSLIKSLDEAEYNDISVYEAMVNRRNIIRRIWNRIEWKCIGTTLLTKWLEFDIVIILNAHKFECPKNLYVALTRASKKLIIFTESTLLSPYV